MEVYESLLKMFVHRDRDLAVELNESRYSANLEQLLEPLPTRVNARLFCYSSHSANIVWMQPYSFMPCQPFIYSQHPLTVCNYTTSKIDFAVWTHQRKRSLKWHNNIYKHSQLQKRTDKLRRGWKPSNDLHFCIERFTVLHRSFSYFINTN